MTTKPAPKPATPLPEFPFPVVNGMVAVEHVRYLRDDCEAVKARLVEALRDVQSTLGDLTSADYEMGGDKPLRNRISALLRSLGEDA